MSGRANTLLAYAGDARDRLAGVADLEAVLAGLTAEARAAWPDIELAEPDFLAHLAGCLARADDPVRALRRAPAGDLFLACACSRGDPRALREFERLYIAQVATYVARVDASPAFVDEVRQFLRIRLLIGDGEGPPRVRTYGGSGPLGAWVRVAALRVAQNLKAGAARERGHVAIEVEEMRLPGAAPDPELEVLRRRFAPEIQAAFRTTLAELPARERNVLCLYYVDGLSGEAIAAMYDVHAATIRRRIERCRAAVLERTLALVRERLEVSHEELESILALVQSQIDVSLSLLLRAP